jgi:hypothetical protein
MKWDVVYQEMPFAHSEPKTLVVEAESRVAAYMVAFGNIQAEGDVVNTVNARLLLGEAETEAAKLPFQGYPAKLVISSVKERSS